MKPFNKSGNFREMSLDDLEASSIVLPRDNFRIQQDVPIKESQRISLGTQMLKLLFGDGIDKLSGFKLQNSEFTGKELKEEFNNTFVKYIDLNKQQLFNEIGVDSNGRPIDIKVTI